MGDNADSSAGGDLPVANPQLSRDGSGEQPSHLADGGAATPVRPSANHSSYDQPPVAFSNQLDMNPQTGHGRSNVYNMMPLAQALPHTPYRSGPYNQNVQTRFPQAGPHSVASQMQQYTSQSSMGMPNQSYYPQQQAHHMAQYYAARQVASGHAASSMPARQNMQYYQPQLVLNHPQAAYYYPQAGHYPAQGHPTMGQMPSGHYDNLTPGVTDPRLSNHSNENLSPKFQQHSRVLTGEKINLRFPVSNYIMTELLEAVEGRQSAVRGPPRKPKQSGQ
jgi:hypothetical protein